MGLGGEVDDRVRPRDHAVDQVRVGDVALDDGQAGRLVRGDVRQGGAVARVRELVQDDDVDAGVVLQQGVDEIGSDEPGPAGHNDLHGVLPLVFSACGRGPAQGAC